jgi:16S rRNA (uracil1498-N3)-methyltransferase
MNRFYCKTWNEKVLDEHESHHAINVMRLDEGATITLFDGQGKEGHAKIQSIHKGRVAFEIISTTQTPTPATRVILGQAIPKAKSMDLIIQKAAELGISEIWPLVSNRTVVHLEGERSQNKTEKWQLAAIEACKQCGENWLPKINSITKVPEFLSQVQSASTKLIASLQPNSNSLHSVISHAREQKKLNTIVFMIGPEGDFTSSEILMAENSGFEPVSLGKSILRVETATIFMASVLKYELLKS